MMSPVKHSTLSEAFVLTIKSELCFGADGRYMLLLYPPVALNFLAYMKHSLSIVYYS